MGDRLTFLGHSTVLIDSNGVRLLTDPLLGHLAAGALRRHVPPVSPETLVDLSAVFISHGHLDHLDLESLRALPGEPAVIVPAGLGRIAAKAARGAVHEMRAGDRLAVGHLMLEAVHAEHSRRRSLFTSAEEALGILIDGSTRVYFAGDTDFTPEMHDIAVDIAMLPVSGTYVMTSEEAAEAALAIHPKIAVPMHYGAIVGSDADALKFKSLVKHCQVEIL